jgi:hypothetical protein
MATIEQHGTPSELVVRTRAQRDEAEALLQSLIAAKATSEKNLAALRQPDVLKRVTGKSSMDNAIQSTRRLVSSFNRMLTDLETDLTPDEAELLAEAKRASRA